MSDEKRTRVWNIKQQADIAMKSFEKRPDWVKSISHFSGTNTSVSNNGVEVKKAQSKGETSRGEKK